MRLSAFVLVFAAAASGQAFRSSSMQVQDHKLSAIWGPPTEAAVVADAPYSADELQEYTPTNGGMTARSSVIGHYVRDTQGRIRKSQALKPAPVWLTEIFDPVAEVAYLLDEQNKIAHEMQLPPAPAATPPVAPTNAVVEKLGTSTIEGVAADGTRMTFRSLTIERWDSPELKATLSTKSSNGYSTRLMNLRRDPPDPALFRPPDGYTVVHEDKPFAMSMPFE